MKKTLPTDVRNIGILICAYLSLLLVCSCHTSPLYPNYFGGDSAIFSLMGKGVVMGKTLYTDLFDHKGPFIFLINALGHLIGGRNGIFLFQCIFGSVSVCFLYLTGKMLRPNGKYRSFLECFALILLGMVFFFYSFESGNLTEEYSLPFISVCAYLFVKYFVHLEKHSEHPPIYAFVYGICLAFVAFLRLNNAVTICAGILYIGVYLCVQKKFHNLLMNMIFGLLGLTVVAVPVLMYCWFNGNLYEMLYATFLHNFVIAGNTAHVAFISNWKLFTGLYAPFFACFVLLLYTWYKQRKLCILDGLLLTILFFNFLCLWLANRFPHYFAIFVPVYLLFLLRYLRFDLKRDIAVLCVVLLCAAPSARFAYSRVISNAKIVYAKGNVRYTTVASDYDVIPDHEKDSVIGFEVSACDYLALDIIPCYKYYTLQQTWSITTPTIMPDFVDWVSENRPTWLLTWNDEIPEEVKALLEASYSCCAENEYIVFYRLNEAAD